jgi:SAM-dependent methyltransferase
VFLQVLPADWQLLSDNGFQDLPLMNLTSFSQVHIQILVFSSLAVHYIKDFDSFVASVNRILVESGVFIFSQEHPLTTAPPAGASWTRDKNGNVLYYNLMGYMRSGQRSTTWIVNNVIKYHRPFSEILNAFLDNGFAIEKMIETVPAEETLKRLPHYEKDLDKPNFLLMKTHKR